MACSLLEHTTLVPRLYNSIYRKPNIVVIIAMQLRHVINKMGISRKPAPAPPSGSHGVVLVAVQHFMSVPVPVSRIPVNLSVQVDAHCQVLLVTMLVEAFTKVNCKMTNKYSLGFAAHMNGYGIF